jgi:hypothetical protein
VIGVLHTTESDPGTGPGVHNFFLRNPNSQPHVMVDPQLDQAWYYIDARYSAKALRNLPGGVETNRREQDGFRGPDVYQVEIVGRAKDIGGYSDQWYDVLQRYIVQFSTLHRIRYSYRTDPQRMSFEEWNHVPLAGWFGHCHVPENDHWDPGTLDYSRLTTQPLPTESLVEQLMALEPTTPVTVSGQQYALINVLGWTLEGINALRSGSPAGFTPSEFADELAKRLQS